MKEPALIFLEGTGAEWIGVGEITD